MSKRKKLIAGNWKMNLDVMQGVELVNELCKAQIDYSDKDVLVAPSFTNIYPVAEAVKAQKSKILVASQNMYFEDSGAYTGEISAEMIKSAGANYVIIGHSERRAIFKETDIELNKKVKKALASGFSVIFCVGETLWEREAKAEVETVLAQVGKGLEGVTDLSKVVIAYEPVWAIGTGKTASASDAQNMHAAIRAYIAKTKCTNCAEKIQILYGGSVKADNAKELMNQPDIDGALVGGASLKFEQFIKIVNYSQY